MNMFDEIDQLKIDLPKIKTIQRKVNKYHYNIYQKIAFIILIGFFFLGIIFGNLFPVCGSSSSFYAGTCSVTEFNVTLMLIVWFSSFILSLFIFGMGHIIVVLDKICDEIQKIH